MTKPFAINLNDEECKILEDISIKTGVDVNHVISVLCATATNHRFDRLFAICKLKTYEIHKDAKLESDRKRFMFLFKVEE